MSITLPSIQVKQSLRICRCDNYVCLFLCPHHFW